jgi:hypothetical protein
VKLGKYSNTYLGKTNIKSRGTAVFKSIFNYSKLLLVMLVIFLSAAWSIPNVSVAQDFIELRFGASITGTDPDALNEQIKSLGLDASSISGFNLDVYVNIPLLPIGAGLRYEWSCQDQSTSSNDSFELDVRNISLLVDWRIIDNALFYVGPLLTLGYPSGAFKLIEAGIENTADIDPDQISFALAVEGGIRISMFIIGAELGYTSVKLEPPGLFEVTPQIDMSGFFARLQLGIGIL